MASFVLDTQTASAAWYVVTAVVLVGLTALLRIGRRPSDYPPGPRTVPLLGNLHQLPKRNIHKTFQAWSQQYGPVFSVMMGTKTMVVLSSDVAVKEVLDRNSAITNERGDHYIGHRVLGGGEHILLMPNGPKWRLQRKLVQKLLNANVYRNYLPYTLLESEQMLYDLLHTPDNFVYHMKRYSYSTALSITNGCRCPSSDDPTMRWFLASFDKMVDIMQASSASLPDVYSILRHLPDWLLPARAEARAWYEQQLALYLRQWDEVRAKRARGEAALPCFARTLQRDQEEDDDDGGGFSDTFGAFLVGAVLEAGTDSAANELVSFIQAMLLFPAVQQTAQAELDRVVGADRLPGPADLPRLPYVRACVKETLRWFPAAVMGAAPHAAKTDLVYNNMRIPAGALLVNNVYAIHTDPARHADPRVFRPERYLGDDSDAFTSSQNPDPRRRDSFVFGAGRRLCPGIHVAEQSLSLGMARLLWAFAIRPKRDASTDTPMAAPDPERYTKGVVCMPEPFPVDVSARSPARAALIEATWAATAREKLDGAGQWMAAGEGPLFGQ